MLEETSQRKYMDAVWYWYLTGENHEALSKMQLKELQRVFWDIASSPLL
jgi:hypothetical protein